MSRAGGLVCTVSVGRETMFYILLLVVTVFRENVITANNVNNVTDVPTILHP